ncbi:MAG: type VI secretion protein IcmF/TssM N-terminal domain-containing protein, partial [Desulfobacterales bacterium]
MKTILLKALKAFLIITAVLLAIILTFGIVLSLDWPWWVGIFLLAGLLGLWLAIVFVKKIWHRQREKHFVHQVIEQDEAAIKSLDAKDAEVSQELQARWTEAIEALKASHLKKFGNPLYVLPWYMVIGESGSGKTTAIKSARLSSPFTEISQTSGISGTRNCDWWFFEHAILIDTAGRYTIPVNEDRDKKEWQKFLLLLAKFRKKEPLNGLVVTIAADMLLESGAEVLEENGQNIRRRIDELMRVIGTKFPVYVLVTKCDLVQGMDQFCDFLPEKNLNQAMGLANRDSSADIAGFLDRTIHFVAERLRDLRLLLLHKPASTGFTRDAGQSRNPSFILFPEEFERLKSGLNSFTKGAFQENPYQETPLLRGLFFSSGRQEGTPYSHFLKTSGLIGESEVLPGTSKGLFLHDFFSKILPKDRHLFAPTMRTLQWSRLTKNIGLTAWVTIAVAICGLLSFSFVKNLKILRDIPLEFSKPPALQGDILADLSIMDRYRQAILQVEKKNRRWWIPKFGLNESNKVEIQLKDNYCRQFREGFSASLDRQMMDNIADFSASTPGETIGRYVAYIARRINLLNVRLNGEDLKVLHAKLQPFYNPVLLGIDSKLVPEIVEQFDNLNLYYLIWQKDSNKHRQDMKNLQAWLDYILTLKGTNLNWLAD